MRCPDLHNRIETGKGVDLPSAAPAYRLTAAKVPPRAARRAIPLDEFRHDIFAEYQIGENDRRNVDEQTSLQVLRSGCTLYAATIGTPASASSSVEVPDLVNAARAVRKASFFSSGVNYHACRNAPRRQPPLALCPQALAPPGPPLRCPRTARPREQSPHQKPAPCAVFHQAGSPASPAATAGPAIRNRFSSSFGRKSSIRSING